MKTESASREFKEGLHSGIPICLGYLSVSFAFGIAVVSAGYPAWFAVLISATNLTSAGQLAGLTILQAGGGFIEMAMTQFIINLRYALMSFSLTQKLSSKFGTPERLAASFVVTDEIFAVAASRPDEVSRSYFLGLSIMPVAGWITGTFLGAAAGGILPAAVVSALGIAIYGMFIAIVVPEAKKHRNVLLVVAAAAALSCILNYTPVLNRLSGGFVIIISAVAASLLGAALHPVAQKQNGGAEYDG